MNDTKFYITLAVLAVFLTASLSFVAGYASKSNILRVKKTQDNSENSNPKEMKEKILSKPKKVVKGSYIIELKSKPIAKSTKNIRKKINELKKKTDKKALGMSSLRLKKRKNDAIKRQSKLIEQEQDDFIKQIKEVKSDKKAIKVGNKYKKVFNGLSIYNISKEELEKIKKLSIVEEVYKNYRYETLLNNSVDQIKASQVWKEKIDNENITGKSIDIAVIDSGVDYTHQDLGNCTTSEFLNGDCEKVVGGYDFGNNDSNPMECNDGGHGTHVSGIAAGNGTLKGVAPGANLYVYKTQNCSSGSIASSSIISAIERSVDPNQDGDTYDHHDIISMSLGTIAPMAPSNHGSYTALKNAIDVGVIPIIAAGNSGPYGETITAPGSMKNVITVGASTGKEGIPYFSSSGPAGSSNRSDRYIKPEIIAPGYEVCSARFNSIYPERTCIDSNHISLPGTSMATPHVAGAAALLLQANPDWNRTTIKSSLVTTARNMNYSINQQGGGLINVEKALNSTLWINKPTIDLFNQSEVEITVCNLKEKSTKVFVTQDIEYGKWRNSEVKYSPINLSNKSFNLKKDETETINLSLNRENLPSGVYEGYIKLKTNLTDHRLPIRFKIEENMPVLNQSHQGTWTATIKQVGKINRSENKLQEMVVAGMSSLENRWPIVFSDKKEREGVKGHILGLYTRKETPKIIAGYNHITKTDENYIEGLDSDLNQKWKTKYTGTTEITGADITGDSTQEIIAKSYNKSVNSYFLSALNSTSGDILWKNDLEDKGFDYADLEKINLDSDEKDEILMYLFSNNYSTFNLSLIDNNGDFLWSEKYDAFNPSEFRAYISEYSELIEPYNSAKKTALVSNSNIDNIYKANHPGTLLFYNVSEGSTNRIIWSKDFKTPVVEPKRVNFPEGSILVGTVSGDLFLLNKQGEFVWKSGVDGRIKEIYVLNSGFIAVSRPYAYLIDELGNIRYKTRINRNEWERLNTFSAQNNAIFGNFSREEGEELGFIFGESGASLLTNWNLNFFYKLFSLPEISSNTKRPSFNSIRVNKTVEKDQNLVARVNVTSQNNITEIWTDLPLNFRLKSGTKTDGLWEGRLNLKKYPNPEELIGSHNLTFQAIDSFSNKNRSKKFSIEILNPTRPKIVSMRPNSKSVSLEPGLNLSVEAQDDSNLTKFILATNETGNWSNKTVYNSPKSLNEKEATVTFEWNNSSVETGTVIGWKVWINNSFGLLKESPNLTFEKRRAVLPVNGTVNSQTTFETPAAAWLKIKKPKSDWEYLTRTSYNRSNYTASFTPHDSENYSVKVYLNDSTGSVYSLQEKNLTVEAAPEIIRNKVKPEFPMTNENISLTINYRSTLPVNASINLTNSSGNVVSLKNSTLTNFENGLDSKTNETYNKSLSRSFKTKIYGSGKWNLSSKLKTSKGHEKNLTSKQIFYKPYTFNISFFDSNNNPTNRSVLLQLKKDSKEREINLNASKELQITVPDLTNYGGNYSTSIMRHKKANSTPTDIIKLANNSLRNDINITSEFYSSSKDLGDKLLYTRFSFSSTLNYLNNSKYTKYNYTNIDQDLKSQEHIGLYKCTNYSKTEDRCNTDWSESNLIHKSNQTLKTYINSSVDSIAFGEKEVCGNGYCASDESSETCEEDCEERSSPSPTYRKTPTRTINKSLEGKKLTIKEIYLSEGEEKKVNISDFGGLITKLKIHSGGGVSDGEIKAEVKSKDELEEGKKIKYAEEIGKKGGNGNVQKEYISHRYLKITTNFYSNISLEFKVGRDWIEENKVKAVFLGRYHENGWQRLETEKVKETESNNIYQTNFSHLSLYSITGTREVNRVVTAMPPERNRCKRFNQTDLPKNWTTVKKCPQKAVYGTQNKECKKFNYTVPDDWKKINLSCQERKAKENSSEAIKKVKSKIKDRISEDKIDENSTVYQKFKEAEKLFKNEQFSEAESLAQETLNQLNKTESKSQQTNDLAFILILLGVSITALITLLGFYFNSKNPSKTNKRDKVKKLKKLVNDKEKEERK